jgi:UDP-N-acetylglucosamine 4-epimerase
MTAYEKIQDELRARPVTWLVTGCAGFIGSHLIEKLLSLGQKVVGLDNLSTGSRRNVTEVQRLVGKEAWRRFRFVEGDIRNLKTCQKGCRGVDYVLHQAALGSVPRSVADPLTTNQCNVDGFLNMLIAARDADVESFVYASSSSVYGDDPELPKVEHRLGEPLSPYAVSKRVNELYAGAFSRCYKLRTTGLRYFNVFGPRQDPNGAYAAVIPKWIDAMRRGASVYIYGDGETSRDFCYVDNVVQANVLAATVRRPGAARNDEVFNIACHERITLNELFATLRESLLPRFPRVLRAKPRYRGFRVGDVRHSLASIEKAERLLGYCPTHSFAQGIVRTAEYVR